MIFVCEAERRQAITCAQHRESVHGQRRDVQVGERRIVFDDKDSWTYDQGRKSTVIITSQSSAVNVIASKIPLLPVLRLRRNRSGPISL